MYTPRAVSRPLAERLRFHANYVKQVRAIFIVIRVRGGDRRPHIILVLISTEQIGHGEPCRRDDFGSLASCVTFEEHTAILSLTNAQTWLVILMGGTEGYPTIASTLHPFETLENFLNCWPHTTLGHHSEPPVSLVERRRR